MGWTETVQYFAGGTLARHSEKRTDSAFISAALTDPATKFIAYDAELNALLTAGQGSRIAFLSHADVKPLIDLNGERAFEGNGRACQWLFLGVEEVEGKPDVACFAIDVGKPQDEAAEGAAPKIEAISALEQRELLFGLFTTVTDHCYCD